MTIKEFVSQCKKCKTEGFVSMSEVNLCPVCSSPEFSVVVSWSRHNEYKGSIVFIRDTKETLIDKEKLIGNTILRCCECGKERPAKDIKVLKCAYCGNAPKFVRYRKVKL